MSSTLPTTAHPRGSVTPMGADWGPFDDYRTAHRAFRRVLGKILEPFGLVVTDYSALRLTSAGPLRPTLLSRELGISPAATTDLMDRLEGKGLVTRERDPTDRRATILTITREGQKVYRDATQAHQRFLEDLAREMDPHALRALQVGSKELRGVLEARARRLGAAKEA